MVDQGNNIDSSGDCGLSSGNNSIPNGNPMLGTPAGNLGGSTTVYPLEAGSEAIHAGTNRLPPDDQRGAGFPRQRRRQQRRSDVDICALRRLKARTKPDAEPNAFAHAHRKSDPDSTGSATPTGSATQPAPQHLPTNSPTPTGRRDADPKQVQG